MKNLWPLSLSLFCPSLANRSAPARSWSFREWIDTFTSSGRYYDDELYDDLYDDEYIDEDGDYDDLGEFAFLEPFVIVGLVMAIMALLYYRQQRQQMAHQREQEQEDERARRQQPAGQPPQQPAGLGGVPDGFFPPPGDPANADWLAGAIGH